MSKQKGDTDMGSKVPKDILVKGENTLPPYDDSSFGSTCYWGDVSIFLLVVPQNRPRRLGLHYALQGLSRKRDVTSAHLGQIR